MDFSWSPEQLALREAAARFAQRELNDRLVERDARGEFSRAAWEKCAEFGILGFPLPPPYGSGYDLLTVVLAMEGLGYGCEDNGLLFDLGAQIWSGQVPLRVFG